MKKKLEMLLMVLAVISISVNLISCANVSDVEVKRYAENESKKEEELNEALDKVRESKEDNRTETIIGGEEKALDKVRESKEEKEPETYSYTTNEKGERVYRVYDDYVGEEVDNPELYKDEYYIGGAKGKKVPTYDTLADKWANYSKEVRDIIEKYEGKDYQTSRTITQSELKTLHNAGLYMITADTTHTVDSNSNRKDSGGHNEIMTKEQLEQYIRDNTTVNSSNNNSTNNNSNIISGNNNSNIGGNNSSNNIGGNNNNNNVGGNNGTITNNTAGDTTNNKTNAIKNNSIMTQVLNPPTYVIYDADAGEIARNVRKKIQEGLWEDREAERDKIARMYAKKNTDQSNPAQYINSLGNGNYVVKFGLVVPSEENATYYESLRGQDKINYWYTEWMVFKQNNQGRISFAKDSIPRTKYKENTFGDLGEGNVGMMLWVSRTPNEERVTFWGKPQYAHVHKTFPEYYDKCGGTDMAFMQWGAYPMAYEYDYGYNKIVEGVFDKESQFKILMDRENW